MYDHIAHDSEAERLLKHITSLRMLFGQRVAHVQDRVRRLHDSIRETLDTAQDVEDHDIDGVSVGIRNVKGDISKRLHELEELQRSLDFLRRRFDRELIYIVISGESRQGKSSLIRTLTGLRDEIPTGEAGDCTAVRTIVQHRDAERLAYAWFHSPESLFKEVIKPYFDKFAPERCPGSFAEFVSKPLPKLDSTDNAAIDQWKTLITYRDRVADYRELLTGASRQTIPFEEIREYVAKGDSNGTVSYWKYMAVREVHIECPFPRHGLRQLALIDGQGLGALEIGIEQRMIATVEQLADAVVFVKKAAGGGGDYKTLDASLYTTVKNAVPRLPLNKWAFLVINVFAGCEIQGNHLKEAFAKREFRVVETIVADCSSESAADQVLKPILNHLCDHLKELDEEFVSDVQTQLNASISGLNSKMLELKNIATTSDRNWDDKVLASRKFAETWRQLCGATENGSLQLKAEEKASIKEQFANMIVRLKEANSEPWRELHPDQLPPQFYKRMNDFKSRVAERMCECEALARTAFDNIRDRLRAIFESPEIGGLAGLQLSQQPDWWAHLAEEFGDGAQKDPLATELKKFGQREFFTDGQISSTYKACITHLTPGQSYYHPLRPGLRGLFKQRLAFGVPLVPVSNEEAESILKVAFDHTVSDIAARSDAILSEIVNSIEAMVRRFVDTVLSDSNKDVWRALYETKKDVIWKEAFEREAVRRRSLINLTDAADSVLPQLNCEDLRLT